MGKVETCALFIVGGIALLGCRSELDIPGSAGVGGDAASGGFAGTASGPSITSGTGAATGSGGAPSASVSTGIDVTSSVSSSMPSTTMSVGPTATSTTSGGPMNQGLTCEDAIPISIGLGALSVVGTTNGGLNLHTAEPMSGNTCWNTDGPERVYAITAEADGMLTAWLPAATTTFKSALFRASICEAATQSQCVDNWGTPNDHGGEVVSVPVIAGQTQYLIVDGVTGEGGDYVLELDLSTGADCSDPIPITVEGQGPILLSSRILDIDDDTTCASGHDGGAEVVYEVTVNEADLYNFFLD
ncbi:MAG: hypothetical protein HOV80_34225 [Polyangiaceae bacterium]|nr:hypothetical protein [Polyangiaceae bacterium]